VFVCLCIVVSNTYCAYLFVHSGVQCILCLVLDTTIHKQTNTICIGHHYTQTNKHNMYWTPLYTHKHNMCWTPLCTHKQAQYVLDTTIHKQTSTICVGHHYAQTNKHNMCWTPLYTIVFVCLCIVVSNTYCACLCVNSGVQYILCLFVCV
jgi:hypothetical protein